MGLSEGMMELVKILTSQASQFNCTGRKNAGDLEQLYSTWLGVLLGMEEEEARKKELRRAAGDFLAVFTGNCSPQVLDRRIGFGRWLHTTEVSLEQLVATYGRLFGYLVDDLASDVSIPDEDLQVLKCAGMLLFLDLGFLLHGYEGEVARRMQLISETDPLTGLWSRRKFEEELEQALEFARRGKRQLSLLWIDVDDFKLINDIYGYCVGDAVLKVLASYLQDLLSEAAVVARIGGNEFGVLLVGVGPNEALERAQVLRRGIAGLRISPLGEEVSVTASIGGASYPHHGESVNDLMCAAEVAQIMAKRAGKNRVHLLDTSGKETVLTGLREKVFLLRKALSSPGSEVILVPFYQPVVDLETGEHIGYEVLARLQRKRRGEIIPAGYFIKAAEQYGLMMEVSRRVLEQAMQEKQGADWAEDKLFFINFSMREVENGETTRFIADLLDRYHIRPEEVVAEITEREGIQDLRAVQAFAREMADLGVRVAVDDFGSGFSSFVYLRYFDCYFAKIEGSLVREITRSSRCRLIVENMVRLLQSLSIEVIAECVESRETVEVLRRAGVRYGQGYYLGSPSRIPVDRE